MKTTISKLSEEEQTGLKKPFRGNVPKQNL
jgi:hypothetical protein